MNILYSKHFGNCVVESAVHAYLNFCCGYLLNYTMYASTLLFTCLFKLLIPVCWEHQYHALDPPDNRCPSLPLIRLTHSYTTEIALLIWYKANSWKPRDIMFQFHAPYQKYARNIWITWMHRLLLWAKFISLLIFLTFPSSRPITLTTSGTKTDAKICSATCARSGTG
jgi:hypothetical protein